MSIIVDAYNVLHCSHVLPGKWSEVSAAGICRMIHRAGVRHGRAWVVCDGTPPRGSDPTRDFGDDVELVYAGGGRDADSYIERLIEEDSGPRELYVVSNDNRLKAAARRRGATPMGSEEFLRRLYAAVNRASRPGFSKPTSEPDPDYWLRAFGLDKNMPDETEIESETDRWLKEFGFDTE